MRHSRSRCLWRAPPWSCRTDITVGCGGRRPAYARLLGQWPLAGTSERAALTFTAVVYRRPEVRFRVVGCLHLLPPRGTLKRCHR